MRKPADDVGKNCDSSEGFSAGCSTAIPDSRPLYCTLDNELSEEACHGTTHQYQPNLNVEINIASFISSTKFEVRLISIPTLSLSTE